MDSFWLELNSDRLKDGSWQDLLDSARGVCVSWEADLADEIVALCDRMLSRYKEGDYTGIVCVSIPHTASESPGRIASRVRDIYNKTDRRNLMVGLAADKAGIEAASVLASEGIPVNMTKLFSPARAQQAAEALIASAHPESTNLLTVSVAPYDAYLNEKLKKHGLAQNRIGFFVATKIYNQTEEKNSPKLRVMFGDMERVDPNVSETYYIENLTLPNAEILLGHELFRIAQERDFEESFRFQNRHLDAFFGFLAPASISLSEAEEKLFQEAVRA